MKSLIAFLVAVLSFTFLFAQENISSLGDLPEVVSETSGLIYFNGKLITHNDSDNAAQLIEIDTTSLEVARTVTISNAENIDWEDLTHDDTYIYIGDFGNNLGLRTNLAVHRIAKTDYLENDVVQVETISFKYEDQNDFSNSGNSDWDAEAFFVFDDQLVVLTKQWKSEGTVAYTLPKVPGTYEAKRIDSYNVAGLVTGATYNTESKALFIIGYNSILQPFVLRIDAVSTTSIFAGDIERTNLNVGLAQTEAIAFVDAEKYFITSESFSRSTPAITLLAQLFRFDNFQEPNPEEPQEPEEPEVPEPEKKNIELFQKAGFELLEYELNTNEPLRARAIYDITGKQIHFNKDELLSNEVDLSSLRNGVYYVVFYFQAEVIAIPFLRN